MTGVPPPGSGLRPFGAEPQDASQAKPLVPNAARTRRAELLLRNVVDACHSHIDGRDLLAEIHPRRSLDIKRRVDGRETWHEGDWLTDLQREIDRIKAFLFSAGIEDASAIEARRAETLGSVHESAVPNGETDQ